MRKKIEELITIVVPVYNVEKYLKKCIDSLLMQTYSNLEIILVDDGSTDHCGEICDNYSKIDKRIVVIHKENGGLSDARNVAIDICKGKYITFIDSDDYVEKDYVEYLYTLLITNNSDISICEYKYVSESGKIINKFLGNGSVKIFNKKSGLIELCKDESFPVAATAKLYKIELFNDIRYPLGKLFEDIATTYKLFNKCNKIVFGAKPLYIYLFRSDSISKKKFTVNRLDAIYHTEEMTKFIKEKYRDSELICRKKMFVECIYAFKSLCSSEKYDKKIAKMIYEKIKNNNNGIFNLLTKKMKLYYIFSKFGRMLLFLFTKLECALADLRL